MGSWRMGQSTMVEENRNTVKNGQAGQQGMRFSLPLCLVVAGVVFPLLRFHASWPPEGYVELSALALQWSVGLILTGSFFVAIRALFKVLSSRRPGLVRWGPLRTADLLSSAFAIFFVVFLWQVLMRCQRGELWDKDGIVCLARGVFWGTAFLPLFLILTHPGRSVAKIKMGILAIEGACAGALALFLLWFSLPIQGLVSKKTTESPVRHVLLYLSDTTRMDSVGMTLEGVSLTPHIDAFSRGAIVYTHAYANAPWTLPSHASFFTGLLPAEHGACSGNLWLDEDVETLAEAFQKAGYVTMAFSDNALVGPGTNLDQGFDRFYPVYLDGAWFGSDLERFLVRIVHETDKRWGGGKAPLAQLIDRVGVPLGTAPMVSRRVLSLLSGHGFGSRPFFFFINVMTPHTPYNVTELGRKAASQYVTHQRVDSLDGFDETWLEFADYLCGGDRLSKEDIEALRGLYWGEVAQMDKAFGILLNGLEGLGLDKQTLLIFMSDHGEEFGEHGFLSHHYCVYDTLLRVPFILRCPWEEGTSRGETRGTAWALVGLPSLLSRLTGVPWDPEDRGMETQGQYAQHGYFLKRVESHIPETTLRETLDERLVWRLKGNKKYIVGSRNGVEIYDLSEDPGEMTDLAKGGGAEMNVKSLPMGEASEHWLAEDRKTSNLRMSPDTRKKLEQLGYL